MLTEVAKKVVHRLGFRVEREMLDPPDFLLPFLESLWPVVTDVPLIRCGGSADGAYLVPDDLAGIKALFSPGVEAVAAFETDMAARGMTCYMADASVASPPVEHPAFRFDPKFLGLRNTDRFTTIDTWVEAYEPGDSDLILQMDIEGAEWTVLSNASDTLLKRFRIIILEAHCMGQLLDDYGHQVITEVLTRLMTTHHLVHNHPNNWGKLYRRRGVEIPEVLEMTFLRKDRATVVDYARRFPHPLDVTNGPDLAAQPLPANWHAPERGDRRLS